MNTKKKSARFFLLACVVLTTNCGCKKNIQIDDPLPIETPALSIVPPAPAPIEIGSGSGTLLLQDQTDKNFVIKAGTYTGFQFKNLKNVTIDGLNKVKVEGGMVNLFAMNRVALMNFNIENSPYRAIQIFDDANDLILQGLNLINIKDNCISFRIDKPFTGDPSSFSNNIQLLDIVADNINTFFDAAGSVTNNGFTGLIKKFKMANCTIKNSPLLSDGVWLGCAENYEFSNNKIDNVNSQQGNHNGIFHVVGNGKFFDNTCTNHQGNMVRAWTCSITTPGTLEIYNNVVWNSSRYGAFEIQVPPSMKSMGAFKPIVSAMVYNNTVGLLNTGRPKYFEGRLLDLYNAYTTIQVYNNLLFNNADSEILNNSSTPDINFLNKFANNIYKEKASDAVGDLKSYRSVIPGVGASR